MSSCSMPAARSRPARPRTCASDARCADAYLGSRRDCQARPRAAPLPADPPRLSWRPRASRRLWRDCPCWTASASRLRQGELVTLLGANGAGKSTTMRALSGLLRPVSGSITLAGAAVEKSAAHRIVRRRPHPGARGPSGVPRAQRARQPDARSAHPQRRRSRGRDRAAPAALSAPEASAWIAAPDCCRAASSRCWRIARGLMARPRLLLLDEPSLGLAPAIIDELFGTLAELRDQGITILLVDQMAALALRWRTAATCWNSAASCGPSGRSTAPGPGAGSSLSGRARSCGVRSS